MSIPTIRFAAHRALIKLEWLEKHVRAHPDTVETRERLADEIEDIEAFMLRVIGAQREPREVVTGGPLSSPQPLVVHTPSDTESFR